MGEELCQKPAERQGCALDQEARQELLRLQEPCERGCRAQTDPSLRGDRRERAGQPEIRWASEQGQHVCGRIRGQRVSLGRNRGEAQGARFAQSHSSAREPQASAIEGAGEREPPEEQGSGSRRAHIRCSANLTGRSDCTNDWHCAGESQDRPAEPRLQHPPARDAAADSHRSSTQANDKIVIVRGALTPKGGTSQTSHYTRGVFWTAAGLMGLTVLG